METKSGIKEILAIKLDVIIIILGIYQFVYVPYQKEKAIINIMQDYKKFVNGKGIKWII